MKCECVCASVCMRACWKMKHAATAEVAVRNVNELICSFYLTFHAPNVSQHLTFNLSHTYLYVMELMIRRVKLLIKKYSITN